MTDKAKNLKISLKPFNLPVDRHYVKVGGDVIKFQSEFCQSDGSHLQLRFILILG